LNIYIAPLQENYSEALPTPARSNKAVNTCHWKCTFRLNLCLLFMKSIESIASFV